MALYKATVCLYFDADDKNDACDAVSGMLTETLMQPDGNSMLDWGGNPPLINWSYVPLDTGERIIYPGPRLADPAELSEEIE